jgi:hypothetical protein
MQINADKRRWGIRKVVTKVILPDTILFTLRPRIDRGAKEKWYE